MTYENKMCDCCGQEEMIGVANSGIGPISIAWCKICIETGTEPGWIVAAIMPPDWNLNGFCEEHHEKPVWHDGRRMPLREFITHKDDFPEIDNLL